MYKSVFIRLGVNKNGHVLFLVRIVTWYEKVGLGGGKPI